MPRSLKVAPGCILLVKSSVQRNGFPSQKALANEIGLALSTVKNFLSGKPVDYLNFVEISEQLGLSWREIAADLIDDLEQHNKIEELELLDSIFYLERIPYESQCYEEILKPGSLTRIKAPQQLGKTCMLERVLFRIREQGYQTITLSFELADSTIFSDLSRFSRWFCASTSQNLGLPNNLDDYWDDIFGCSSNTTAYFQKYLLQKTTTPLVLALDNVDLVFEHPDIADDFCRLLRGWYDMARRGNHIGATWQKLRLVVVHSTEVYSSLDINSSPLAGIGLEIELPEFSFEQVQELVKRYELDWNTSQIEQLMAMVGGHPYLVKKALDYLTSQQMTLEQLLAAAPTEAGPFSDHLRRQLGNLQQYPELAVAFDKVVKAIDWVTIPSTQLFKLQSMGLIKLQGNSVIPSCDLYRKYFRERLVING
ncbi:MAG: hypothetical protein F6J86_35555 [Symploca sp. SIO1B1]|nr:hypothetical protein [Symploca sp. SIO1C2]NER99082.1 hypothetical protein [Symploca sp. SIO1B1]